MEPKERFEIQLSHVCNNRCVFCVSGQMTELRMAKPTPLPEVKAKFDEAAARGITKATILGGEPTIHPTFFPTVEYALELGFETIVIFTNGTRLDKQAFIDRIMALGQGKLQWRISLQGWDEATHDLTTKKPGAFAKIIKGLETLTALGEHISCNMCVVEQNYRSLPKLTDFVLRYDIRQVHLDMVRPRDSGVRTDDYLDGIMPDYAALGRVMGEMFKELEARAPGFDINVGNLPYCQLPEWAQHIHHGGAKTYTVSADGPGKLSVVAWDKYEDKRSDKRKLDSCEACVFERRCDGFVELYAQRRGTDQFLPVSREKLRRADPDQRTFVHQIDAALVAMVSERFEGWRLHSADDSEFDRWARQTWAHAEGGRATIELRPRADREGEELPVPDALHRDFQLRVLSWVRTDEARLWALVEGLFTRLSAALGGRVEDVLTAPSRGRLRANLGRSVDPGELSPAVSGALNRLCADSHLAGGWRIVAVQAADAGARVDFSGPGGARASLHLSSPLSSLQSSRPVARAGGGPRGRWDFGRGHVAPKRQLALAVKRLLGRPASAPELRPAAP